MKDPADDWDSKPTRGYGCDGGYLCPADDHIGGCLSGDVVEVEARKRAKQEHEESVVGGMLERWRDDINAGGLRPAHNVIPIHPPTSPESEAIDRHPAGAALLGIPETNASEDCIAEIRTLLVDHTTQAADYRVHRFADSIWAILTKYGY